jgi:hypothetical protein
VPVALNGCVVPSAIDGCVGVTAIETSTAALTVSVVALPMPVEGSIAEMLVAPTDTLLASPADPGTLLTAAIPALDEAQVAELVRSCVLPSL